MAARFDFTFTGDKALQAQLAGLTDKLERRILAQAINKATKQVLLPAIQAATPIGRPYTRVTRGRTVQSPSGSYRRINFRRETGRLRRSLKVKNLPRRRGRVGSLVQIGTRASLGLTGRGFYPAHQEFGFMTRQGGRRVTLRQHFAKKALLQAQARWLAVVAQETATGFEREVHP